MEYGSAKSFATADSCTLITTKMLTPQLAGWREVTQYYVVADLTFRVMMTNTEKSTFKRRVLPNSFSGKRGTFLAQTILASVLTLYGQNWPKKMANIRANPPPPPEKIYVQLDNKLINVKKNTKFSFSSNIVFKPSRVNHWVPKHVLHLVLIVYCLCQVF